MLMPQRTTFFCAESVESCHFVPRVALPVVNITMTPRSPTLPAILMPQCTSIPFRNSCNPERNDCRNHARTKLERDSTCSAYNSVRSLFDVWPDASDPRSPENPKQVFLSQCNQGRRGLADFVADSNSSSVMQRMHTGMRRPWQTTEIPSDVFLCT